MSKEKTNRTLLIGIGNSSRQDDGLGWRFVNLLDSSELSGFDVEYRYQLQIEDAELISGYKRVIFVDATSESLESGFYIKPCNSGKVGELGSHSLEPETVISLCDRIFETAPICFIIGIEGSQWELKEGLSEKGERNLCTAHNFFIEHLFDYI